MMGTYTANKELYMPSIGEQGWGELMNTNLSTIDTFLKPITVSGSTYTFTGNQTGGTITATKITNSGTLTNTGKITANGGIGTTTLTASSTSTFTGKITANGGIGTKALTTTSISNSGNMTNTGTLTCTGKITANGGVNDYDARITACEEGVINGVTIKTGVYTVTPKSSGTFYYIPYYSSDNIYWLMLLPPKPNVLYTGSIVFKNGDTSKASAIKYFDGISSDTYSGGISKDISANATITLSFTNIPYLIIAYGMMYRPLYYQEFTLT